MKSLKKICKVLGCTLKDEIKFNHEEGKNDK